jgi:hypothetical protein
MCLPQVSREIKDLEKTTSLVAGSLQKLHFIPCLPLQGAANPVPASSESACSTAQTPTHRHPNKSRNPELLFVSSGNARSFPFAMSESTYRLSGQFQRAAMLRQSQQLCHSSFASWNSAKEIPQKGLARQAYVTRSGGQGEQHHDHLEVVGFRRREATGILEATTEPSGQLPQGLLTLLLAFILGYSL